MSYEKKLKLKTLLQAIWALTGIAMIILYVAGIAKDKQSAYFGAALCAASLIGAIKKIRILRNPGLLKKSGIAENDERNISLMLKAKNSAASISASAAFLAIIYFMIVGNSQVAETITICVCAYVVFYIISYYLFAKKS